MLSTVIYLCRGQYALSSLNCVELTRIELNEGCFGRAKWASTVKHMTVLAALNNSATMNVRQVSSVMLRFSLRSKFCYF